MYDARAPGTVGGELFPPRASTAMIRLTTLEGKRLILIASKLERSQLQVWIDESRDLG